MGVRLDFAAGEGQRPGVSAAPYPYDAWPRYSRASAEALNPFARFLRAYGETARARAAELLGLGVTWDAPALYRCAPNERYASLSEPFSAAILSVRTKIAMVEFHPALGSAIADRLLGGEGSARPGVLSMGERGALAFFMAQLVAPLEQVQLMTVLTTREAADRALGVDAHAVAGLPIQLGPISSVARLWLPLQAIPAVGNTLPNVAIPLVIDMAEARLTGNELRRCRPGDVLLLEADECFGHRRVRALGAERSTWWVDEEGCVVRVDTLALDHPLANENPSPTGEEEAVSNNESKEHTSRAAYDAPTAEAGKARDAVGDVPVRVSVEIARFTRPLESLGAVAEGEILISEAQIGEHVRLRVGERDFATGELVNVDGHVGVRIIRRLG